MARKSNRCTHQCHAAGSRRHHAALRRLADALDDADRAAAELIRMDPPEDSEERAPWEEERAAWLALTEDATALRWLVARMSGFLENSLPDCCHGTRAARREVGESRRRKGKAAVG